MMFSSLPPPPGLFFLSVTSQSILILLSFLSLFQATQLTHDVEGWLKGVMEEADKEKALKQVVEATLNEKVLELAMTEQTQLLLRRLGIWPSKILRTYRGNMGRLRSSLPRLLVLSRLVIRSWSTLRRP